MPTLRLLTLISALVFAMHDKNTTIYANAVQRINENIPAELVKARVS